VAGEGDADRPTVRDHAAAPTTQQGAPLPVRSALAAQVKLARLADVLVEAAGILRELSQESLELRAETRLMSHVETTTTPARLLSVRDVAERLYLSERTVRRLRQRGDLPRGIEVAGTIRWTPESIDAWIGGQR
jgi:predicted DNA-binding transcriptional regulator AlpA